MTGSDFPAHLVGLLECWASGDVADLVYAAGEHCACQCAAWETVHLALDGLFSAFEGLWCVIGCGREQVSFSECVIAIV